MKTKNSWLLAAALLIPLCAAAKNTPPKPAAEQWKGFALEVDGGGADHAKIRATVYYNSEIRKGRGVVDVLPAAAQNKPENIQHFSYENSFRLFDLKRLPDEAEHPGIAIFAQKELPLTLYVDPTEGRTRFVVRADDAGTPLALADKPTKDALGVQTLLALEAAANRPIANPNNLAMRAPAPKVEPNPQAQVPPPATDELAAAVDKMFQGDAKLKIKGAFIYAVAKNAESASEPDRTRLLAQRQLLLDEAKEDWANQQDLPQSVNQWLADPAVKTAVDNYIVTPKPETKAILQARGVSDDDVMSSFCPDVSKKIGNLDGSTSFQEAKTASATGNLAANAAKPEDVKGGSVWDKTLPAVEAKCEEFRKRTKTPDSRVAPQNGQSGTDPIAAAGAHPAQTPTITGDGKFHVTPEPAPEDKPKANPLKNQINAGFSAVWLGLLGFIFGGPAGALVMGAAGAGLGYWMSKYK